MRVNGGLWRYVGMKGELEMVRDELPYNHEVMPYPFRGDAVVRIGDVGNCALKMRLRGGRELRISKSSTV